MGRVSEVGPLTSWVVLAGDPNCRFSALIKESRSQGGIVSPRQYSSDPRVVELTYLPNDVELRPGQAVVTSGLGGGFPKEIPVGQVVDFVGVEGRTLRGGPYQTARQLEPTRDRAGVDPILNNHRDGKNQQDIGAADRGVSARVFAVPLAGAKVVAGVSARPDTGAAGMRRTDAARRACEHLSHADRIVARQSVGQPAGAERAAVVYRRVGGFPPFAT